MSIRYERNVKVTPRIAREWLKRNVEENRNPKTGRIPGYARDMATGRWRPETGETIKFDPEGWLIDGQNRLYAVIEANEKYGADFAGYVEFDVAYDVPRESMLVLDTGASRTYADSLKTRSKDRMRSSSIVRWVTAWDAGFPTNSGSSAARTHSEIDEIFESDPLLFSAATLRGADCYRQGLGAVGPTGTAYVLIHRVDAELCEQFFDAVIGGANLPESHPALLLRARMGRARMDRLTPREVLALYIRAWNWFHKNATPKNERLTISRGELTNATFPRPM